MSIRKLEYYVKEKLAVGGVRGLYDAMIRGLKGRAMAISEFENYGYFRARARRIKEECLDELPELVKRFKEEAEKRGARVHIARDAVEANEIVAQIVAQCSGPVIKAKSLTSEEIELNKNLESVGVKVLETDLGELIVQLANERPTHIVFPAIHKSLEEVVGLISKIEPLPSGATHTDVLRSVRKYLRPFFLSSEVGIIGANAAIAENGAILLETNEGNGRLVSIMPKKLIVIMGVEKVVRTLRDAMVLARSHAVSATGQRLTVYVTVLVGRSPLGGKDRELHVVVIDNGRSRMLKDPLFKEALYCIRCGACMNVCSPYGYVGGDVFGHIYPGPIGIPWTANVYGIDVAAFSHLCISCGLCHTVCPVEIDIPFLIARVKEIYTGRYGQPLVNRVMMSYERFAYLASHLAPISNWALSNKVIRTIVELTMGIDRRRSLPKFKRNTFKRTFDTRLFVLPNGRGKVALYIDLYADVIAPEVAWNLSSALHTAGIEVVLPRQRTSGYPYFAYGDLKRAKEIAEFNVRHLAPLVEEGYHVVSIEPTATYALKHLYPKLLRSNEAEQVSKRTFGAMEYLLHLVNNGLIEVERSMEKGSRVGVHVPCHARSLDGSLGTLSLLSRAKVEYTVVETGMCCGMAGTFGLKRGSIGYDLSVGIGDRFFQLFKREGVDLIVTESSVCMLHLSEGTGIEAVHPLIFLRFTKSMPNATPPAQP